MTSSLILYYSALAYLIGWWLIVRFCRSAAWRRRREVDREIRREKRGG